MIYFVVRKIELTDVIKYAALCRITGLASLRPREITPPSLTREVQTTEDASPKFAYLVLRNTRRPASPDYLSNSPYLFVLVISNINTGFQKSLTVPLIRVQLCFSYYV